jgi:hypothetical protein
MDSLFKSTIKSLGVCCPAEYLHLTRTQRTEDIAEYLGFHIRTIAYWRRRWRLNKVKCEKCSQCLRRSDAIPLELPRQKKRQPLLIDSVHLQKQSQVPSPAEVSYEPDRLDVTAIEQSEVLNPKP